MELQSFQLKNNQTAQELLNLHHQGEQLANTQGDLTSARRIFATGLAMYEDAPLAERTNAADLAYARILRDDGFTIKKLQQHGPADDLPDPFERLQQSRRITEGLLGLPREGGVSAFGIAQKSLRQMARRNRDLGYLMAEHGATVGGLGRLAARHLVDTGLFDETRKLTRAERKRATEVTKDFGKDQAYGFTWLGNNGYYRTSDAMNGPRVEVAKGGLISKLKAAKWLGRAAMSIGFTARYDRGNFLPALKTTARLAYDVRGFSRKSAIRAIRNHL